MSIFSPPVFNSVKSALSHNSENPFGPSHRGQPMTSHSDKGSFRLLQGHEWDNRSIVIGFHRSVRAGGLHAANLGPSAPPANTDTNPPAVQHGPFLYQLLTSQLGSDRISTPRIIIWRVLNLGVIIYIYLYIFFQAVPRMQYRKCREICGCCGYF